MLSLRRGLLLGRVRRCAILAQAAQSFDGLPNSAQFGMKPPAFLLQCSYNRIEFHRGHYCLGCGLTPPSPYLPPAQRFIVHPQSGRSLLNDKEQDVPCDSQDVSRLRRTSAPITQEPSRASVLRR